MNLEKLTVKSQEALQAAQEAARQAGHPEMTPEHLLQALLNQDGGLAPVLLNRIGTDVGRLRSRLSGKLTAGPRGAGRRGSGVAPPSARGPAGSFSEILERNRPRSVPIRFRRTGASPPS